MPMDYDREGGSDVSLFSEAGPLGDRQSNANRFALPSCADAAAVRRPRRFKMLC